MSDDTFGRIVYGGIFGRVKQQMDDAAAAEQESGDDVGNVTEVLDSDTEKR